MSEPRELGRRDQKSYSTIARRSILGPGILNTAFTESHLEEACLDWFRDLGYEVRNGLDIAPGEVGAERTDYREVVLEGRLRAPLARINPQLPREALDAAARKGLRS